MQVTRRTLSTMSSDLYYRELASALEGGILRRHNEEHDCSLVMCCDRLCELYLKHV